MTPTNPLELEHYYRMLEAYVRSRGRDSLPDMFGEELDRLAAIRFRSQPLTAEPLAAVAAASDSGLMTFTQASQALGYSRRHLTRLAADDGPLVKVGRRLTAASVRALQKGHQ